MPNKNKDVITKTDIGEIASTSEELQFAKQIANGFTQCQAYLNVFKCQKKTARVGGCKMYSRPHVKKLIIHFKDEMLKNINIDKAEKKKKEIVRLEKLLNADPSEFFDENGKILSKTEIPYDTLELLNIKPKTPLQKGFFDPEKQLIEYTYNSDTKIKIMEKYYKLLGITEPEKEEPEKIQILSDNDDLEQMLKDELARREEGDIHPALKDGASKIKFGWSPCGLRPLDYFLTCE